MGKTWDCHPQEGHPVDFLVYCMRIAGGAGCFLEKHCVFGYFNDFMMRPQRECEEYGQVDLLFVASTGSASLRV